MYDLPGTLVTPGFVDGHAHFAMWALNRRRVRLAGAKTRDEVLGRVRAAVPVQGWVVGQGWDANRWRQPPERSALDDVHRGPVYLDSLDVHAAWINSAALTAAGITRETPDPYGGRIVRDAAGEPTGLLLERAVELMTPHLPQPPREALDAALLEAQREAHLLGVTGIHDVENLTAMSAFERLEARGSLRLRVLFHPPVDALPGLIERGVRSGAGSEWLTVGGVKMFLDGSLGSRTARMLEPYESSRDRGMPITAESVARDAMRMAAGAGIASTVHAIGDAARIVVSMQPAHLLADVPLVDRHWGSRGNGAYAFRTLLREGSALVFGSDVPVASIDPREGVFAALERRADDGGPAGGWRPEEKVGLENAVRAALTVVAVETVMQA